MAHGFDHEKLRVYNASLEFLSWLSGILERVPVKLAVHDHLDRSSTSIPLNIAEGNGKFSAPDRCKYFDIARGSALECAAALDALVAKGILPETDARRGKEISLTIVSMLVGLIKSNSPDRLHEAGEKHEEAS
jgi:four helix bundle protein